MVAMIKYSNKSNVRAKPNKKLGVYFSLWFIMQFITVGDPGSRDLKQLVT